MTSVFGGSAGGVRIRRKARGTPKPPPGDPPWSGPAIIGETTADLQTMLGIRGEASKDILEDSSHLWNAANAGSFVDEGTLDQAGGGASMFRGGISVLDSEYVGGTRYLIQQTDQENSQTNNTYADIPDPADGTRSLMIGGLLTITDLSTSFGTTRPYVFHQRSPGPPTRGWIFQVQESDLIPYFSFDQVSAGPTVIASPVPIVLNTPMAFLCNVDIEASVMKIVTSIPGSYAETPVEYLSSSLGANGIRVGDGPVAGGPSDEGANCKWAQMFTFEYDDALDAEISEANMVRWLQYMDGTLTL